MQLEWRNGSTMASQRVSLRHKMQSWKGYGKSKRWERGVKMNQRHALSLKRNCFKSLTLLPPTEN
jgi:hypothetical protein